MRLVLALLLVAGTARAEGVPHESWDLGACLVTEYAGPEARRVFAYERDDKQRVRKETITFWGTTSTTTYAYDKDGRLATTIEDDARTTFAYDKAGKLIRTETFHGSEKTPSVVRTYRYDAQGREVGNTQVSRGVSSKLEYAFTYDAAGRLSTIKVGSMVSTLRYDTSGRLASTEENDPVNKRSRVLTYKYDAKGRRIEETSPTGRTEYRYDCHAAAKPSAPPTDVRDKPGYCGRPNCGTP